MIRAVNKKYGRSSKGNPLKLKQHANRTEDCTLSELIYIIPKDREIWQDTDMEGKLYLKLPIMKGANRRPVLALEGDDVTRKSVNRTGHSRGMRGVG